MSSAFLDRARHVVTIALETIVMVLLVIVVVLAILGLVEKVAGVLRPPFLAGATLTDVLDDVLGIFVLIELLATAAAYIHGTEILRRIFETIFVAITRKLIVIELNEQSLQKAIAVGILLIAAGLAAWFVARARALNKQTSAT
jgi:uncharacterized membrane protein (DUF373 family)